MATHTLEKRSNTGNSPLAGLDARVSPQAVGQAQPSGTGNNFTGQYLYDRFIEDQDDVTKLDIVRQMATVLDTDSFKKTVAAMIDVAKERGEALIEQAKKQGIDTAEAVKAKNAKIKTAQNYQSIMRNTYGILRHCKDDLAKYGVTNKTGYHEMEKLAPQILKARSIRWNGEKALTSDQADARKKMKLEDSVLAGLRKDVPRLQDETLKVYNNRLLEHYDDAMAQRQQMEFQNQIDRMARDVVKKAPQLAEAIANRIIELLNTEEPETVTESPEALPVIH